MNCGYHFTHERTKADIQSVVFAFDPSDGYDHKIPVGKQTLEPSHIYYRPCSGIWQSVWIESVPENHISDLSISGDTSGQVNLTVFTARGEASHIEVEVKEKVRLAQRWQGSPYVTDLDFRSVTRH